jgi:DNA-binding SARP family transcriptional activator
MPGFRVLGTFEIAEGDRPLTPTAPKLRTVMALLALHRNRVVSVESLIEEIWSSGPPASAQTTLQTYIYQLRKLFATVPRANELLLTKPLGYTAAIKAEDLDSCEFARLVDAGRAALDERRPSEASRLLREAVGLRRGPILADIQRGPLLEAHAAQLEEAVLQALTLRIEADIQLGTHAELIGELRALVSTYPLYEDIRAKLMVVLYRANRRSAALQVYHDLRTRLDEELGLDPSPALQRLHQDVLVDDPSLNWQPIEPEVVTVAAAPHVAASVVPAELPADLNGFVGRREELQTLDAALVADGAMRVVVVTGMPGVGKSVTAVHAAHRVRGRFRDGQLYAELGGGNGNAADPHTVLGGFLRAIGMPAQEIPNDLAMRSKLFRTWAADRNGLLLLDDAESVDQIRPLMPGGPGWTVFVTSRYSLRWLPGAVRLELGPLPIHEGVELLDRVVGGSRISQQRQAAFRLVSLCDRLPLTIRAIGHRLALHGDWSLAALLDRLGSEHGWLAELSAADLDLRDIVEPSCRRLSDFDRNSFLLLGAADRGVFTADRAADVLKADRATVDQMLERLVSSNMVRSEPNRLGTLRYRIPHMLRLFAWQSQHTDRTAPVPRRDFARVRETEAVPYTGRRVVGVPGRASAGRTEHVRSEEGATGSSVDARSDSAVPASGR